MNEAVPSTLLITEALAEINTIGKRLEKKQQSIVAYVARDERIRDPLLSDARPGGSTAYIAQERQSVQDLTDRIIALRRAIARANVETILNINGTEMSLADWLVWKREVYPLRKNLLDSLLRQVNATRAEAAKRNVGLVGPGQTVQKEGDIIVHLDEQALNQEREALEETFGKLDGALSVKNATVTITV